MEIEGDVQGMVLLGDPGIGKSYLCQKDSRFVEVSIKDTPQNKEELYDLLRKNAFKGLVFSENSLEFRKLLLQNDVSYFYIKKFNLYELGITMSNEDIELFSKEKIIKLDKYIYLSNVIKDIGNYWNGYINFLNLRRIVNGQSV